MQSGLCRPAQIFVAALGASSLVFAEATWTQSLPDWLMSNRRMLEYYGGVSEILVPDNLRSGVSKANRYEAKINPSYQEFASHYGTCVIPARVRKPRDKAYASYCTPFQALCDGFNEDPTTSLRFYLEKFFTKSRARQFVEAFSFFGASVGLEYSPGGPFPDR